MEEQATGHGAGVRETGGGQQNKLPKTEPVFISRPRLQENNPGVILHFRIPGTVPREYPE